MKSKIAQTLFTLAFCLKPSAIRTIFNANLLSQTLKTMPQDLSPLWISLKTALLATFITFFLGISAAYWMLG
ncbi:MAG: hypothetical protein ACOVOV_02275, partial [Dolichospermum sp.]